MKLTLFLIIGLSLSSYCGVRAQTITIDVKDMPFKSVTTLIQKQTGYSFAINERLLSIAKPVTVSINNLDLEDALYLVFKDQPFDYQIKGKIIVVVAPANGDKDIRTSDVTQPTVSGKVTDSLGNPLQGVTVQIIGTKFQTSTDNNGMYAFNTVPFGAALSFRLLSYHSHEVFIDGPVINVVLRLQYSVLDETEVRGYYSTTKRLSTGNVKVVAAKDIASQPVGNPLTTLHGRVAGLSISQLSGVPGKYVHVEIRGRNSMANGNDPLYIVDGVPFSSTSLTGRYISSSGINSSPFNSINPTDIESITILKDGDATAIYGSQGANGVVLITTKKGKAGKTQIDATFQSGIGRVTNMLDMLSTQEYLELRREAFKNSNREPRAFDYDINGTWDTTAFTDWQKIIIGNTARTSNAQLRLSGGTELTQYTISGGYQKETTVFPGNFYDKRYSFQSGFQHRSADKRFFTNISFAYSSNENLVPELDLMIYSDEPPNTPAISDENGGLNWENDTWSNPLAYTKGKNNSITNNYIINGTLSYVFLPGFEFKSSFGMNHIGATQDVTRPLTSFSPSYSEWSYLRFHNRLTNELRTWIAEPQISYRTSVGGGTLESLAGVTMRGTKSKIFGIDASDFVNDEMIQNIQSAAVQQIRITDQIQYRYAALYARASYNHSNRYILNITGRRDGSSRFGPGRQFGSFGAIGAAWVLSEEPFMKRQRLISFGKLRASYGVTGNDQLADYQYQSTYSVLNYIYQGSTGLVPSRHSNPDFGWESVKKLEAALELGLAEDRITLTASWYRNRTGNQLVGYSLPEMTGFPSVQANLPAVIENRGLEFETGIDLVKRPQFRWSLFGNISFPQNRLLEYPDFESSTYRNIYKVGSSMYGSWRYVYNGVDPETGLYRFNDLNRDGELDNLNDRLYFDTEPKFFGGLTNEITWKDFGLSFHFHFVNQTKDIYIAGAPGRFIESNFPKILLNRWQQPGDEGKLFQKPLATANDQMNYFQNNGSNALLVNASFIRLKNLNFSYNLPRFNIKDFDSIKARLFIQGQNLLTITGYDGIDPEITSGLVMPPIKMVTAGINVTF